MESFECHMGVAYNSRRLPPCKRRKPPLLSFPAATSWASSSPFSDSDRCVAYCKCFHRNSNKNIYKTKSQMRQRLNPKFSCSFGLKNTPRSYAQFLRNGHFPQSQATTSELSENSGSKSSGEGGCETSTESDTFSRASFENFKKTSYSTFSLSKRRNFLKVLHALLCAVSLSLLHFAILDIRLVGAKVSSENRNNPFFSSDPLNKKNQDKSGKSSEDHKVQPNQSQGKIEGAPLPLPRYKPTPTRQNFTDAASDVLDCVEQLAFTLQHGELSRAHLISCLLEMPGDRTITNAVQSLGGDAHQLKKQIDNILIRMRQAETALAFGEAPARPELRKVVVQALQRATADKRSHVGIQDLFAALAESEQFRRRLQNLGVDADALLRLIDDAYHTHTMEEERKTNKKNLDFDSLHGFGVNLTDLALEGKLSDVIGREDEIEQITSVLSRLTKSNCLLIGEPGVGKTAVVEGFAKLIANGQVPDVLLGVSVFSLDVGALISGTSMRGEFERRMKVVLDHLLSSRKNTILFIDEVHTLMGAGKSEGPLDAANMLKPALARGEIRVVGATTRAEYRKYIEKDPAFARRFIMIEIKEPTIEKTIETLKGLKPQLEQHHALTISDEAVEAAARLASRYVKDRHLPDKAIDLLDDACGMKIVKLLKRKQLEVESAEAAAEAQNAIEQTSTTSTATELAGDGLIKLQQQVVAAAAKDVPMDNNLLTEEDVAAVISSRTGISVSKLTESDRVKMLRLPQVLREHVTGQDDSVDAVAAAVIRSRAGLSKRRSPIGTFLFLGSPGVGKTELAKALALELFDDESCLIRLDMSEFSEPHTVSRLVGSSPGYVSHEEGGQLTEAVRHRPHSVVLFDELEHAHPQVLSYLLQILGEARLTDSRGITVDFSNCVIIATSNVGAQLILAASEKSGALDGHTKQSLGKFDTNKDTLEQLADAQAGRAIAHGKIDTSSDFSRGSMKQSNWKAAVRDEVMAEAQERFKSQVVNRMKVLLFNPLTPRDAIQILRVEVKQLQNDFEVQKIDFSVEDGAAQLIVERAYTRKSGARDLKQYFEDYVTNPISPWVVSGWLKPGMRVGLTTDKNHKNALIAQACELDSQKRCKRITRRSRILSMLPPPVAQAF